MLHKNLDIYYQYRACESVMRLWNQRAVFVRKLLSNKVKKIRIYYQFRWVMELWKSKAAHQKVRLVRINQEAQRRGYKSIMKLIIDRWNMNVVMRRKQQIEEECVGKKWREVKEWMLHL